VPYQVRVFAQANESVIRAQVYPTSATPAGAAFATFKELLQEFPDVARGLLRGTLGPPTRRETGLHCYETRLTLDALERDFPNVARAMSLPSVFGAAARDPIWHLQMVESGEPSGAVTRLGEIHLSGDLPSAAARDPASTTALAVPGVTSAHKAATIRRAHPGTML
jgi:hypothetical protein